MERFLKQYDKESMKMAMLKHEETFREQVHELHRLYRVQKLLMSDMKVKELKGQHKPQLERWNARKNSSCDQQYYTHQGERRPPITLNLELPAEDYMVESDDENDLELTLATGRGRRKKEERSYTSDSGASFSSSSAESGKMRLSGHGHDLFQVHSEGKSGFQGAIREDRMKHPPWLYQCLSLNLT